MRKLSEVKRDMENINSNDKELNHMKADNLLVETIKILDAHKYAMLDSRQHELVSGIIEAYDEIDKWFA